MVHKVSSGYFSKVRKDFQWREQLVQKLGCMKWHNRSHKEYSMMGKETWARKVGWNQPRTLN